MLACFLTDVVNRADVRVIQRRGGFSLTSKTIERSLIAGHLDRQEFESHGAMESGVLRFVHDAHAATTESFENTVVGDGLPEEGLRVRHLASS